MKKTKKKEILRNGYTKGGSGIQRGKWTDKDRWGIEKVRNKEKIFQIIQIDRQRPEGI